MEKTAVREPPVAEMELEQRFRLFVGSHREQARRLAWRLVGGDDAAADDVTQEAFFKAYRALDRFREEANWPHGSIRLWCARRTTTAAGVQCARRGAPSGMAGASDATSQVAGDPLLRRRIAKALAQLSRSQKEVFVLVHLEGFSVREAAILLEKPEGTVKSHLHRALQRLRSELADVAEDMEGSAT